MKIHNSMEDLVAKEVNKLYDQIKNDNITWLNCDCEICRLDTICYVLNRITPKYSVSERGALHNALDMDNSQIKIDITSLGLEGIRIINSSQREFHKGSKIEKAAEQTDGKMYYNFPMLIGSVFDGNSFVPLSDISVTVKESGKLLEMYDSTWQNPVKTYKSTKGTYSLWPKPILCENGSETKVFNLSFDFTSNDFTPASFAISLPLVPEPTKRTTLDSAFSLKVKDAFLFRNEVSNPME